MRAKQKGLSGTPGNRAGPSHQGLPGSGQPRGLPLSSRQGLATASKLAAPRPRCWQGRLSAARPGRARGSAGPAASPEGEAAGLRGRVSVQPGEGLLGSEGSRVRPQRGLRRRRGGSGRAPRGEGGRPGRLHLKDCISCLFCGVVG